jgi:hypothetical protein
MNSIVARPIIYFALTGLRHSAGDDPKGVALGCHITAFQAGRFARRFSRAPIMLWPVSGTAAKGSGRSRQANRKSPERWEICGRAARRGHETAPNSALRRRGARPGQGRAASLATEDVGFARGP